MAWVKKVDSDYFYGISILVVGLTYIVLKEIAFDYRLIPFGLAVGFFLSYIFEELNVTWETRKR